MAHFQDIRIVLAICAAAIFLALVTGWKINAWYRVYTARRRMSRGLAAEKRAGDFLKRSGYLIVEYQKADKYSLLEDGRPVQVQIKYDFVVRKGGKTFVAEVKSGKEAPDIRTSATRRQLLEYTMVAQTDGIVLVDMENMKISEIEFPFASAVSPRRQMYLLWLIVVGLTVYLLTLLW